ncbi:MAG: hypothetical protein ACXADF_15045, partial [Candidatus Thorarchaeota archaeon]
MTDQPELGNIGFGHSRGEFRVPSDWVYPLYDLFEAINPDEDGYGENCENDTFSTMRYWWGECDCGMGDDIEPLAHLSTCILLKP